jgi:hypothetical protein
VGKAQRSGPDAITAHLAAHEVPFGSWFLLPAFLGPFGPSGRPTATVTTTTTVSMRAFDPAVKASTGDYWADQTLGTSTYQPLVLAPGASGTITLTLSPAAQDVGRTVRGSVYVDTANPSDPNATGDEVAALPYAYTVAP